MKIVLVDDDPDAIEVMYLALNHAGHDVDASPAGATVISSIKADPPDVLITDLMMAEMTGLELCELMKADAKVSGMQIIVMSARTDKLWKDKAKACGATGFIEKPIDPVTFAADVEQIVAQGA